MELPNTSFQNFPIEFKELNPEYFSEFNDVNEIIKIDISADEQGYINQSIQDNINLGEKNTIVINSAVGQGKTYSIIEIVKKYYDSDENYLIFIASPFISLVEQYYNAVIAKGIPQEQIYKYEWIGKDREIDAWNCKIQIVTANCLLGNPGDNSLINSKEKRNYINYLVEKCESNNKKVVFIYDEIHDTIHNFKEKFIFNLWKWKNVIHKNFIISATFNEASKIVIGYLAELTENKLKILESKRVVFPEKQSELYLHFNPASHYTYTNDDIVELVRELIDKEKKIDILSYSKKLADDICKNTTKGIGKPLFETFGRLQNCTVNNSENDSMLGNISSNRYNPEKCNVGTNFKTGINIEKENHALIIIMPPSRSRSSLSNKYGIFSDGANSIIQAIARQRKKGQIHIILPPPNKFDFNSLPNNFTEDQKKKFTEFYGSIEDKNSNTVSYSELKYQARLTWDFYFNELKENVIKEISYVEESQRKGHTRLEFPDYHLFRLDDGEKYIAKNFFGGDLSSYVTYCAITNQFINCRLASVTVKPTLFFIKGKIQKKLKEFIDSYLDTNKYIFSNSSSHLLHFQELRRIIFNDYRSLYKTDIQDQYIQIRPFSNKEFEQQLLSYYQRGMPENRNELYKLDFDNNGDPIDDEKYTRGDYFRACISHSLRIQNSNSQREFSPLINAYLNMDYFRKKLIDDYIKYMTISGADIQYLLNTPNLEFISSTEDINKFDEMINSLINYDFIIQNQIFDFKNIFIRTDYSELDKKKAFYKYLKQDFFEIRERRVNNSHMNQNISEIIQILDIPDANMVIDFVSPIQ
ncbi:restriction endonuclease subunit R [Apibacter muscae]|uniref:DEAD/DEAH box helicase family protein n=1 Tax=Apibacter muscae TaxID=2509004 RepID=UPI0011AE121F|nr:DEAD/DEAH box helicase family protein [Apibacter muscae]TWP23095.1 restriction endonuclease subunit R [Apibacter muscae]